MRRAINKIISGILTAVMIFGAAAAGTSGPVRVQAAENKAFAAPIELNGATFETDGWWDFATRMNVDLGEVTEISDSYTYSNTIYVPKAVFEKGYMQEGHPQVRMETWIDLNDGDKYLGSINSKYLVLIVHDGGETFMVVHDEEEDKELTEAEYSKFVTLSESGDFFKVVFKDMPYRSSYYAADEDEKSEPVSSIDTSGNQCHINVVTSVNAWDVKLSSIVYIDDLSIKANENVVYTTDFSAASLYDRYYDYTIGEKTTERPQLVNLDLNLLKLSKTSANIKVGKSVKMKATAAANAKITYQSSNKKIATVTSKGVVKGKKAGKATIKVTANGISKSFKVTVKK